MSALSHGARVMAQMRRWTGSVPNEPVNGAARTRANRWPDRGGPGLWPAAASFDPAPPPAIDSEQMARDLAEVKNYPRTNVTNLIANFWEYMGGRAGSESGMTRPAG